jgi:hypothetical protein
MSKCIRCDGTKVRFMEVRLPMYGDSFTRIYLGKCNLCDTAGNVAPPKDSKQSAAGEK